MFDPFNLPRIWSLSIKHKFKIVSPITCAGPYFTALRDKSSRSIPIWTAFPLRGLWAFGAVALSVASFAFGVSIIPKISYFSPTDSILL